MQADRLLIAMASTNARAEYAFCLSNEVTLCLCAFDGSLVRGQRRTIENTARSLTKQLKRVSGNLFDSPLVQYRRPALYDRSFQSIGMPAGHWRESNRPMSPSIHPSIHPSKRIKGSFIQSVSQAGSLKLIWFKFGSRERGIVSCSSAGKRQRRKKTAWAIEE